MAKNIARTAGRQLVRRVSDSWRIFAVLNNPLSPKLADKRAIGHFTVMDGSEAGVELVLIQTFLLYYVNQAILMLTSIFQGQFP